MGVTDDRKYDDVVDGDIISVAVVEDQKRDDVDEGVTNDDVTAEPSAPTRDVIYEDLNNKNEPGTFDRLYRCQIMQVDFCKDVFSLCKNYLKLLFSKISYSLLIHA